MFNFELEQKCEKRRMQYNKKETVSLYTCSEVEKSCDLVVTGMFALYDNVNIDFCYWKVWTLPKNCKPTPHQNKRHEIYVSVTSNYVSASS